MQKGINKGMKEFVDEKIIKNITMLAEANYPDQFVFNEVINILTHEAVEITESAHDNNMNLLKLAYSNKARFYVDEDVSMKVKAIENKIIAMTTKPEKYKKDLQTQINEDIKGGDNKDNTMSQLDGLNKILTYISIGIDNNNFDEVIDITKDDVLKMYHYLLNEYKISIDNITDINTLDMNSILHPKVDEGVIISLMKLNLYFLQKGILNTSEIDLFNTIITIAQGFIVPDNYTYINEYYTLLEKIIAIYGTVIDNNTSNVIKYTNAYLKTLQYNYYKTLLMLNDYRNEFNKTTTTTTTVTAYPDINTLKESNVDKIIRYTIDYYKTDDDVNYKEANAKQLCDCVVDLIHCLQKEGVISSLTTKREIILERLIQLWYILLKILEVDETAMTKDNEEMIKNIMKSVKTTISLGKNEPSLRDIPVVISHKVDNNDEINESILEFTSEDLKTNHTTNPVIKTKDLEILANISRFTGPLKNMMRNQELWDTLKSIYETETDMLNRYYLSIIFRNATKNNFNVEELINTDKVAIKLIFNKVILHTIKSDDNNGFAVATNEVDTVIDVLKDTNNFKTLNNEGILNDDDLTSLENAYKDINDELYNKILPVLRRLAEANKSKQETNELNEDEQLLKQLKGIVDEAYNEHMKDLSNYDNDTNNDNADTNALTTIETTNNNNNEIQSESSITKGRLSIITATLLYNTNNVKVKSLLSVKNNNEMPSTLEQIIALMRKLYNSLKTAEEKSLNNKRIELINECLKLLKRLSLSPDNHKPILEVGLINFMEKLSNDTSDSNNTNEGSKPPIELSVGSKDVLKNCSNSENAVTVIIDSPLLDKLIDETLLLYNNPETISNDTYMKQIFLYDNITFSNICKSKKGFEVVFNKIGLERLLELGKKTGNVDLLEVIINMLINYVRHQNKNELKNEFLQACIIIINKCLGLKDKTVSLISKTFILISLLYMPSLNDDFEKMKIISHMNANFNMCKDYTEFITAVLSCLCIITNDNTTYSNECVNSGILTTLQNEITNKAHYSDNEDIVESLTSLYCKLVSNNTNIVDTFCDNGITNNTIHWIDVYNNKIKSSTASTSTNTDNANQIKPTQSTQTTTTKDVLSIMKQIMHNSISALDNITKSAKANTHLCSSSNFITVISSSLLNKQNEILYNVTALHALGNHLCTIVGDNIKILNLEELYQLLKALQKEFYSNSEILSNINYISGGLVKNITNNNEYNIKFYGLIVESIKCQDWNVTLINDALKVMYDGMIIHTFLQDEVFDDTMPTIFNLLELYKDNVDVLINCYKILALFAKNQVFSYSMVNAGLMTYVKETLESQAIKTVQKKRAQITPVVFNLINFLAKDENNAKRISDDLMGNLIKELFDDGYSEDNKHIVSLLSILLKHKYCIQPFIQFKGLELAAKLLEDNDTNVDLILIVFQMLSYICHNGDEYTLMMRQVKLGDIINGVVKTAGVFEKKIEYEGRSLVYLINMAKVKLEEVDDIDFTDIKIVNPIKPEVKNFLTSGKQLKIINNNGDVKQMQLTFSQDLLKITAKKIKSNLPPKPKYVIETAQIKQIVKGHGTDAFKKSKRLFRSIPKPEFCFSIIGPTTIDGVKAINVQCETEAEVNKWLNYMEIVINHFKKTKTIKSAVVIKK